MILANVLAEIIMLELRLFASYKADISEAIFTPQQTQLRTE
jgi:hypothetical protein